MTLTSTPLLSDVSSQPLSSISPGSPSYEIFEINALNLDTDDVRRLLNQFSDTRRWALIEPLRDRITLIARSFETNETYSEYIGIAMVEPFSEVRGNLYIRVKDKTPFEYDNTCELLSVEVVPHWQHRGVGTQLVVNAMKKAASTGQKYLQVQHRSWTEELEKHVENPNFDPQRKKELLPGKIQKVFFEKLPGFLPRSSAAAGCRENELRFAKYDLSQISEVRSIPLSVPEATPKREKLSTTAVHKSEPLSKECRESVKGLVFQIWEGEILRGTLLGTVHAVPEEYLQFRSVIREGLAQCSTVLCESDQSYRPSDSEEKPGLGTRVQLSNGKWIGGMDEELISIALTKEKLVRGLEDSQVGQAVRKKVNRDILASQSSECRQTADEAAPSYSMLEDADLWANGNLEAMGSKFKKSLKIALRIDHFAEDCDLFVNQRNIIQAQGILEALAKDKEENVFAMVGAGHLPDFQLGSSPNFPGVISILQANGYRITQI